MPPSRELDRPYLKSVAAPGFSFASCRRREGRDLVSKDEAMQWLANLTSVEKRNEDLFCSGGSRHTSR
jgi:hypothetical protein